MERVIDRPIIDVAVLCKDYTTIGISCDNNNIITLDEIEIKKSDFCKLFYATGEKFGIPKELAENTRLIPFISFEAAHRTVKGKPFFLLEAIMTNLEHDLNISRNCFTTSSRIAIANEFSNIHTLCDINSCSVIASLTWSNIEDILHNYELSSNKTIAPIFCVSVTFNTPTEGVRDSVCKFYYKITGSGKESSAPPKVTTTTTTTTSIQPINATNKNNNY